MLRATLGSVEFDVVENENISETSESTDHSVEQGQDVSDHVKHNPSILTITGVFVGKESPRKLQQLRKHRQDRDLLTYSGRNIFSNVVITGIDRNHNASNKYGLAFDITLKRIRITQAKNVSIKVANPKTKKVNAKTATKVKTVTNKGKQQPKTKVTTRSSRASTSTSGTNMRT